MLIQQDCMWRRRPPSSLVKKTLKHFSFPQALEMEQAADLLTCLRQDHNWYSWVSVVPPEYRFTTSQCGALNAQWWRGRAYRQLAEQQRRLWSTQSPFWKCLTRTRAIMSTCSAEGHHQGGPGQSGAKPADWRTASSFAHSPSKPNHFTPVTPSFPCSICVFALIYTCECMYACNYLTSRCY